jgi:O-antigen/teichoic acid export membrane protein
LAFVTTLILARLLAPADFGLLNMAMIVVGFARIFKDLGTCAGSVFIRGHPDRY